MAYANDQAPQRSPTSPGEVLREEFLDPLGISPSSLAEAIGFSRQSVYQLLSGSRSISAEMALALGECLGTTPEFWLNLQEAVDLHKARSTSRRKVVPLHRAATL